MTYRALADQTNLSAGYEPPRARKPAGPVGRDRPSPGQGAGRRARALPGVPPPADHAQARADARADRPASTGDSSADPRWAAGAGALPDASRRRLAPSTSSRKRLVCASSSSLTNSPGGFFAPPSSCLCGFWVLSEFSTGCGYRRCWQLPSPSRLQVLRRERLWTTSRCDPSEFKTLRAPFACVDQRRIVRTFREFLRGSRYKSQQWKREPEA